MGGDPPPPPAPPPAPAAPNYAAANREAVQADIDTLGTRRRIEQASKLGKVVYDPDSGKTYDFTGLGDAELGRAQAEINAETADKQASSILDIQRKYGADFNTEAMKRLDEADPYNRKIRLETAQRLYDDVLAGAKLTAAEQAEAEEQIRGAQTARGNAFGNAAVAQEILGKYELGQKKKQQSYSNAAAYFQGTPLTAQYQTLSGAQNQTAPYQPVSYTPLPGLNPNAGAQGASFASSIYGSQIGAYNAGLGYSANMYNTNANLPNPWMQGLGIAAGVASSAAAAAI